jgi:hypothetical protein
MNKEILKINTPIRDLIDSEYSSSDEIENIIRTTNSQLEIWTDCLIGSSDANKAYNLSYSIKFSGSFVLEAFDHAVANLVRRHECLRASFSSDGIYMNIYKDRKIEISHNDISHLTEYEKETQKEIIVNEEINSLFDLVKGPLFKVKLIKIDDLENLLVITHHHIIGDGLSIKIILEELGILYSSFIENTTPKLTSPDHFSDYAKKVNSLAESSEYKEIEDFWLDLYKDTVPVLELPIDNPRPSFRTYNGKRLDFPIEVALVNSVKELGVSTKYTVPTILLSAFEVFLSKLTGQNDLIVGFPASGNRRYNMKHMIGDCANLLPLRTQINTKSSFLEYLDQRNPQLLEAYAHHQISFGHLLNKLAIARDPSRVPMVPVTLTVDLNRDAENEFSFSGLSHAFKINPRNYVSFEIKLHICNTTNGPVFQCAYNAGLFKEETIKQMMASFEETINKLVISPTSPLAEIKGNNLADYAILNATETPYPNVSLSELLSKQAEIFPNNIARNCNNSIIFRMGNVEIQPGMRGQIRFFIEMIIQRYVIDIPFCVRSQNKFQNCPVYNKSVLVYFFIKSLSSLQLCSIKKCS